MNLEKSFDDAGGGGGGGLDPLHGVVEVQLNEFLEVDLSSS